MTQLIIARHGNTFGAGDTPTRVGARTDIPLVESGIAQARRIGLYFQKNAIIPDVIYSAELQRTRQTAEYAVPGKTVNSLKFLNEIDYGPDENKTEEEVIKRIGEDAIQQWNLHATPPPGWKVFPETIIQAWNDFAKMIKKKHAGKTVFVVTSNGVARFAPYLTGDFTHFSEEHAIKLKTGALCFLKPAGDTWQVEHWNLIPAF